MMRELKNWFFLSIVLVIFALVLSGCGQTGANAQPKYYTGYNSLDLKFLQDSPPTIFYYDSQATNPQVNTIPIDVQVTNLGSSDTYGALFVYGFDPHIVGVDGYSARLSGNSWTTYTRPTAFNGWTNGAGNYAFNVQGLNVGGQTLSFGFANVNGQQQLSFSTFGIGSFNNNAISPRSVLFNSLGFAMQTGGNGPTAISVGVSQADVGAVLRPITMSMFNTYGWSTTWLKIIDLKGRNPNNPSGDLSVVEFPATIFTLPPSLEQFQQRIMVTACYSYATHASSMVCIDPEPYSNVQKVCNPTIVSLGGGQGAPVSITSIDQKPARGRTVFTISIHHNKQSTYDDLYDYFSLYKCDPASGQVVKATDKNIVYVGYVYLSNTDITMNCLPDQIIRLDESGNGQIVCTADIPPGTSAYEAPMEIELWYGYSKSIYQDVLVKKI